MAPQSPSKDNPKPPNFLIRCLHLSGSWQSLLLTINTKLPWWVWIICSKFVYHSKFTIICEHTWESLYDLHFDPLQLLHLNSDSKIWNDKLCDTQMLMGWDNSWFHSMVKIASRVGSAHNRATYLSANENWIIDLSSMHTCVWDIFSNMF